MISVARLLLLLTLAVAALWPTAQAATAARAPRDDTLARCSWDRPGRNPFTGDVVAAVDRYRDIPTPVRAKLKQRMAARQYDDLVDIRRDSIEGKFQYAAAIRDMHFGQGRVCREVTRQAWTAKTHERGLVYCEDQHCILVPTVCRNVSRIDRGPALVGGDRLMAPPGSVPSDALPGERREGVAAAAAPTTPNQSPAPAPVEPVTSSFAEAVAGAVVPLYPPIDGPAPLGAGVPPGPLVMAPGDSGGFTGGNDGGPSFPPLLPVPGGGGGGIVPVGGTPGGGGGGEDGGGGTPVDPGGPPPVAPIPEPSTWASLLVGLGAMTWVLRRQRRAVVTTAGAPKCATQNRS